MFMIVTNLKGHSWAVPYDIELYNLYSSMNCVYMVELVCI